MSQLPGPQMHWLLYALGGGWGHLQRAVALARRAAARGVRVVVLTNCRGVSEVLAPDAARWVAGIEFRGLDPDLPKAETVRLVRDIVLSQSWHAFVADTFPRGLAGELADLVPSLPALRVWVARDLTPEYVAWAKLREFAPHYDLVLVPGEEPPLANLPQAVRTDPWLLCGESELLPRAAARERLGVPAGDERPVVLVSAAAMPEEKQLFAEAAARLAATLGDAAQVVLAGAASVSDRVTQVRHWPLLELLRGPDLLVGGGGYHTVHEARAAQVPLVAVPQTRLYDRQELRLSPREKAADFEALIARVCERLAEPACPAINSVSWPRGAEQAADEIEACAS